MQQFPYLIHEPGRADDQVIWRTYNQETFGNRSIVARVGGRSRRYFVAPNIAAAVAHIEADEQIYHEVIPAWAPQRLKFDIDASRQQVMELDLDASSYEDRCRQIIDYIAESIIHVFKFIFDVAAAPRLLMFSSSHAEKLSYHIIIDGYYVEHVAQARMFTKCVIDEISVDAKSLIDDKVNKPDQNFRLLGQHKVKVDDNWNEKAGVTKSYVGEYPKVGGNAAAGSKLTLAESFITNISGCKLLKVIPVTDDRPAEIVSLDYEQIRDICEMNDDIRIHHTFRKKVDGKPLFAFDSKHTQTVCTVCPIGGDRNYRMNRNLTGERILTPEECHSKDNFLFVRTETEPIDETSYTVRVFMHCRNARGRGVEIGSKVVTALSEEDREKLRAAKNTDPELVAAAKQVKVSKLEMKTGIIPTLPPPRNPFVGAVGTVDNYCDPAIKDFVIASTLLIKAGMGMGKTKKLVDFITKNFGPEHIIRVISFRQTFSAAILSSLREIGFQSYKDFSGPITNEHTRIVIQVESLRRLKFEAHDAVRADLVILDESESITSQLNSPNHKEYYTLNMINLNALIGYAGQVICMDAYLGRRTKSLLDNLRPSYTAQWVARKSGGNRLGRPIPAASQDDHPIELAGEEIYVTYGGLLQNNSYQNQTKNVYYLTADEGQWLTLAHDAIDAGENIVVCTNSKIRAKHIYRVLAEKFGPEADALIKIYSSESTAAERRDFDNVAERWAGLRVLIYTPTLTAGVSFERKHFDKMFCYFSDMSCDANTCMQMMGRVRNISSAAYYLCIDAPGYSLPTSGENILSALKNGQMDLFRNYKTDLIQYEIADNGAVVVSKGPNVNIWVDNVAEDHRSKNDFAGALIRLIIEYGSEVIYIDDETFAELTEAESMDDIDEIIADIRNQHIEATAEIKREEFQAIADAPDIDDDEYLRLEEKYINRVGLEKDELPIWRRRFIRQFYGYWPICDEDGDIIANDISAKFAETYYSEKNRRIYRNLQRLAIAPQPIVRGRIQVDPVIAALTSIQTVDRGRYITNMQDDPDSMHAHNYVYTQHRCALHIARTIGITSMFTPQLFDRRQMYEDLRDALLDIITNWKLVDGAIEIRLYKNMWEALLTNRGNIDTFLDGARSAEGRLTQRGMIWFCNKVLGIMYGGRLVEVYGGEADDGTPVGEPMYEFRPCKLFEVRDGEAPVTASTRPIIRTFRE